jgi:hypothetical protein
MEPKDTLATVLPFITQPLPPSLWGGCLLKDWDHCPVDGSHSGFFVAYLWFELPSFSSPCHSVMWGVTPPGFIFYRGPALSSSCVTSDFHPVMILSWNGVIEASLSLGRILVAIYAHWKCKSWVLRLLKFHGEDLVRAGYGAHICNPSTWEAEARRPQV